MRGYLKQRTKGSWTIWLELPRDPVTGKRTRQTMTVQGNKKDAQKKLSEVLHEMDMGGYSKPSKITVGDFLRQWTSDYASTHVRSRTLEGYKHIIERHLVPNLGAIPLAQLQPQHLQEYYAKSLAGGRLDNEPGGLSARTIISHHRIMYQALSHAVKWGLVGRNIAQAVDPPKHQNHEMHTLDEVGIAKFLEEIKTSPYYHLFHLAFYTGMRRSELLGLRWKDADLNKATISVVQVLHWLRNGQVVYEQPKTARSRRMVKLGETSVHVLRELRENQEAQRELLGVPLTQDSLVFCQPDGSPLQPDTVTHAFIKLVRRIGLKGIRFHDLRHTHASLWLRQGVHPKIVSERLGHSSIAITLDTYSHVMPGLHEEAVKTFEENLAATLASLQKSPTGGK